MELGFTQFIFEGDFEFVIKALSVGNFSLLSTGHLVIDTKFITGSFWTHSFSYVRRQCNVVAHVLRQRARFFFPLLVWMEYVLQDILHFVDDDFPI